MPRLLVGLLLSLLIPGTASRLSAADAPLTYEGDIRPILRTHCFDCHGAEKEKRGKLDLRLRRLMVAGGEGGPAIVPGSPQKSRLLARLTAGEMPPGDKKVPAAEIETIRKWIAAGAPTARPEPDRLPDGLGITPEERSWWSFIPLKRPIVPAHDASQRIRTPIDALLKQAMGDRRLGFSPDADSRTLARRAYLDLLGRPPTPEELAAFVADTASDAWERLIDRLLANPQYGERWGRHWLDIAGYADSEGVTNKDVVRSEAWKFRDYVIRAINANRRFDRFITEQLAGDELLKGSRDKLDAGGVELMTATGFLRMAADGTGSGADGPAARNQVVSDTLKIVSTALMGVSLGCAQCHDHRYDPISQDDYYRIRAVFEPALNPAAWKNPGQRKLSLYDDTKKAQAASIEAEAKTLEGERNKKRDTYIAQALAKELAGFDEPLRGKLKVAKATADKKRSAEQKALLKKYPKLNVTGGNLYQYNQKHADEIKAFDKRIQAIRSRKPKQEFLRVLMEVPGQVPVTKLFHRGDHRQPRHEVAPGGLTVTAPDGQRLVIEPNDKKRPSTGRRLAWARWLTSGRHPLVGRALVNRIWMHHFGRGLVNTPGEFGKMGEKPTHPVLLDWLATEFADSGWDLKRFHRLIMRSTVYRQVSTHSDAFAAADPENIFYWRKPVFRMDAETIRDSILAVNGRLITKFYGPPVPVKEDAVGQIVIGIDKKAASNRPGNDIPLKGEDLRRSVYIQVRRSRPLAMLRTFDAPVMETNCDRRVPSTSASQSLMMMNSKFILDSSQDFATRLGGTVPAWVTVPDGLTGIATDEQQMTARRVAWAWQLAYNRAPADEELIAAMAFLDDQLDFIKKNPDQQKGNKIPSKVLVLVNLCQALLGSNEFLYID